ncbi:MAG: hypothetical protein M3M94_00225, partial [Actinomycetota bacterium]|nr:hypothetical protein [Actinomycetota bacterium]
MQVDKRRIFMMRADSRRARSVLVAAFTAFVLALAVPAAAFGGGTSTEAPAKAGDFGAGGEGDPGNRGFGTGGLARTGFDAWQIGLLGVIFIGGSLVLIRGTAPAR